MNHQLVLISICFLWLINNKTNGTPQETDQLNSLMIRLHNEVRTNVLRCKVPGQPQAESMPNLTYNQELADKAQKWANNCTFGHDKQEDRNTTTYPYVGQNFAGTRDFQQAFELWFNEHVNYTFDNNSCKGPACGHYTQVVWANTKVIGCAFKDCELPYPYGKAIVCNYGPSGNFIGQQPYVKGDQSACPTTSTTTTTTTAKSTPIVTTKNPPVNPNPTSPASTDHPTKPTVAPEVTPDHPVSSNTTVPVTTDVTTETTDVSRSPTYAGWLLCTTVVCWIAAFF